MPSIFSKLRHKKTPSTDTTPSPPSPLGQSNPSSPATPTRYNQDDDTTSTPARNARASFSSSRDHRTSPATGRRSMDGNRPVVPVPASFKPRSNVNLPSPSSGRSANRDLPPVPTIPQDLRAHSSPFADEQTRPDLPTTSSNVNNPTPDYQSSHLKTLPSLPHISAGPPLQDFALPPGAAPAEPASHHHDLPPLPHVASVDRSGLHQHETERPRPVVAESQGGQQGTQHGFPHVQDMPGLSRGDSAISEGSTYSNQDVEPSDIPSRSTSLHPERAAPVGAGSNQPTSSTDPYDHLRSVVDADITPDEFIARHLHRLNLYSQQKPAVPKEYIGPFTTPALEHERASLVRTIAQEASGRSSGVAGLSEAGVDVFRRSGLGEKVGLDGTVDVHTKWMEPIIQEHIRPIEVHEYCININQDVHKYHVYPKIQPIFDPEPVLLEPRHRIFSAGDGQWHEVIGDAAAIAILGEDIFHNGQKTVREVRKSVLPGFERENGEIEEGGIGRGMGRVREREGLLGGQWGPWKDASRGKVFEGMRVPAFVGSIGQGVKHVSKGDIGVAV